MIARPEPGRARVLVEKAIEFTCRSETGTAVGDAVRVLVRPEEIRLRAEAVAGENAVAGKVAGVVYLGGISEYHVEAGRLRLRAREMGRPRFQEGDAVVASVDPSRCLVLRG